MSRASTSAGSTRSLRSSDSVLAQTAGVVLVSTLFGAKYELPYACAAAFFFGTLHALFMPYRYGALDYLQMNVLGGQALSYFLLHLWQVGITTDERGVDVAVFLIQLILGVSFIVLLVVYLLPGLQEDVIPAARDLQRRLSRQRGWALAALLPHSADA